MAKPRPRFLRAISTSSQSMPPASLSVVIPVYDEAPALEETLERLGRVLRAVDQLKQSQIIVVDDGSTDNAFERLSLPPRVEVIRHPANRGYGAALKTGILKAVHPLIMICDADGTYWIEA